ncbi:MAG: hypothetical protein CMJ31_14565 [Phycisphaerae bacterium]|nr:hypothetical protein [Phycisphaerae bacterium]
MTGRRVMFAAVSVVACCGAAFGQTTIDVAIPNFGFATALIGGYPEVDGYIVTDAEFFLELDVVTGNAANILVEMTAAVDTDPSTEVIDGYYMGGFGSQLGWSGTGIVSYTFDASGFIGGQFQSELIYGSSITGTFGTFEEPGEFAVVTDNSFFRLTLAPAPAPSSVAMLGLGGSALVVRRRR